ncbi:XRE family transcriptional regulator [Streptomyces sp. NPDC057729]|uniref:XRE family transcriptional regulator n=1 Tax=Streptomyces sp. NPDC057729 TaxID=3346230 RepID=UPI0036ACF30B
MAQYDRSHLRAQAIGRGDTTPSDMARALGMPVATAWRLWHGRTAPSATTAAAVEHHYGVTARQLLRTAEQAA